MNCRKKKKGQSPEENLEAAVKALERERFWRPFISVWEWTGIGEKKGWDIFTGLSLPLIVFGGGILFNYLNGQQQQKIAEEKQKDELLKTYINDMKASLLDKDHPLRKSKENDESRSIARTITLTTLTQLNSEQDQQKAKEEKYNQRKGSIMQFLFESGLIKFDPDTEVVPIIPLNTADFTFANLYFAYLPSAKLENANLTSANLESADLSLAKLENANLESAENLTNEQIKSACSWEKAIYTEAKEEFDKDRDGFFWTAINEKANQRKIDEIKQDKASDPPKPPDCSIWK
jgi:hypothetical protein